MTASRQRDIRGPSPIDVHVGERLRLRRTLLRMSQEKLATALGLTFQQVQKYERAANRISAGRLYQLCRILKVPISFFFEEMDAEGRKAGPFASRKPAPSAPVQDDLLRQPDTIELVEAYYRIGSPRLRARFLEFARASPITRQIPNVGAARERRGQREPRVQIKSIGRDEVRPETEQKGGRPPSGDCETRQRRWRRINTCAWQHSRCRPSHQCSPRTCDLGSA